MEATKYSTVKEIKGPLLIVEGIGEVGYGEIVKIKGDGERIGQVLEAAEGKAVIQVFEGTRGLDVKNTSVT
ncbi:MAG: V-type ATP synthase subunit B, partial [Candidatus Thermoplasmatota archaeon]